MGLMMLLAMHERGFYMMFERAKELVREDKGKVKQISDLKIKAVEELSKLEAEIKTLRVKIHELMELADAKEEEIRKLHDRLVELEAKMHRTKFSYKMQLRKILGPENFKKLHRRHEKMKQIYEQIKALEELSKLEAEIKALRVEIHELMELSEANEEEIRNLHDQIVELNAEMHKTRKKR
jgi:peptidoglycan hydrolase CwlO-like protein